MMLVQVEVQGTCILAEKSVDQLSGILWLGILVFLGFIFSLLAIGFGGLQRVDKNVYFIEVF